MATIIRRGPARTELERMDSHFSMEVNSGQEPNDENNEVMLTTEREKDNKHKATAEIRIKSNGFETPSLATITPESACTSECDACEMIKDINIVMFCPLCKQKLCNSCLEIHNRIGGTRNHHQSSEKCMPECAVLEKPVTDRLMTEQNRTLEQLSSDLMEELGIQVCHIYDEDMLEIRSPTADVLDVAIDTIHAMTENNKNPMMKRVHHGAIEWTIKGHYADAIAKLFQDEINSLVETYDVVVTMKQGKDNVSWPLKHQISGIGPKSIITEESESGQIDLVLQCGFENYYAVDCEIEGIKDDVDSMVRTEVMRPKQDEFRMKLYAMMKESSDDVICHVEKLESMYKLVIQGHDATTVENIRQEFLSLFCKECSSCHDQSTQPTFLNCKHVLCDSCVKGSYSQEDGILCPVCSNNTREKTPVSPLQLQCIQVIDNLMDQRTNRTRHAGLVRRHSSMKPPQVSTKLPKYLLNKWKRTSGGLLRLKSLIENTYGCKVAGTDENIKIYGQQQEILDLAVISLEKLNEKTPDTGISERLADKCVEWRLRGDHARIVHFLFNKELYNLKKKFKTVTIQAFTELEPAIVDVTCGYGEFLKVKYEVEELENDIKNMYTDECVQPKNFYHNVKIKEYLQSKRRDEKVHCAVVEKNNLNVVVLRGRKKEFVNAAKEQLLKW